MVIVEKLYDLKRIIIKCFNYITPDKIYLKKLYRLKVHKELNLKEPISYTEKLNWLKLYDRNPEYTKMVDKYAVREYVSKKIGQEYLIPLVGCWKSEKEINFSNLPNQFVLKCNHDNGVIICKDKTKFDEEKTRRGLRKHLKRNFYKIGREWPYKHVPRKILCEKFMVDESGMELKDYKFFCFHGKVQALLVATGRAIDTRVDFFDVKFNHLPIISGYPNADREIIQPPNFNKMIELAERLSQGLIHVRVDLYNVNGKIYFSEMTFFPNAGFIPLKPEEWNVKFGSWICLPEKCHKKK